MTESTHRWSPFLKITFSVVILLIAIDQLSKWWVLNILDLPSKGSVPVLPFLSLTMVWNKGISMGLSLGEVLGKWGIVVMTGGVTVWLLVWLSKTRVKPEAIGLTLIVSGAIGNLIDRFVHGAVVDFIHLHAAGYNFYVFNVADSAITLGVALLLIDGLRAGKKSPKNASKVSDADKVRQGDT